MTAQLAPNSEIPTFTLTQALDALARAHHALGILDSAYAALDQRLTAHLMRAQCLSEALAAERATRLALQAQLADLERQRRPIAISDIPMTKRMHHKNPIDDDSEVARCGRCREHIEA